MSAQQQPGILGSVTSEKYGELEAMAKQVETSLQAAQMGPGPPAGALLGPPIEGPVKERFSRYI